MLLSMPSVLITRLLGIGEKTYNEMVPLHRVMRVAAICKRLIPTVTSLKVDGFIVHVKIPRKLFIFSKQYSHLSFIIAYNPNL